MRRTYTRERYVALAEKLRAAIPDLAFGTDIIVGFPGETEADFEETLEVVEEIGYDSAFTFVYSPRPAPRRPRCDQVPHEVKIERMERLVEVMQRGARERNDARVGRVEQVLVEGPSAPTTSLLRGRTRRNTTVNFTGDAAAGRARPRHDRVRHVDHPAGRASARARRRLTGFGRCASSSPARPDRSARTSRCASCATATRSSASTSGRTRGWTTFRRCSRTSPATTQRSRAGSTASSTRTSTSSSTSPRTRRCTSSCVSRTARSRTRS